MMEWTDRHCRSFHRRLSRRAKLYTEMVTADAVLHGDQERLIGFSEEEHPIAVQLGGSDPEKLARASRICADRGYDEINLNCGCPSDRVQSGAFGACLMRNAPGVAECFERMQDVVDCPVTIKCRIGVDDDDPEERLFEFVETVAKAGCKHFVVHARKAWLKGLSPKENREVPPLDYDLVLRLKAARPELQIVLNGGLENLDSAMPFLDRLDGVMLGRAAYHDPELLGEVDKRIFGENSPCVTALRALEGYRPYVLDQLARQTPLHAMTRHLLGLFSGQPGARSWRRTLSEKAPGAVGADAISIYDMAVDSMAVRNRVS